MDDHAHSARVGLRGADEPVGFLIVRDELLREIRELRLTWPLLPLAEQVVSNAVVRDEAAVLSLLDERVVEELTKEFCVALHVVRGPAQDADNGSVESARNRAVPQRVGEVGRALL